MSGHTREENFCGLSACHITCLYNTSLADVAIRLRTACVGRPGVSVAVFP